MTATTPWPDKSIDMRWTCRHCGRFIPDAAIRECDYRDATHFGVGTATEYTCSRCGTVHADPRATCFIITTGRTAP